MWKIILQKPFERDAKRQDKVEIMVWDYTNKCTDDEKLMENYI